MRLSLETLMWTGVNIKTPSSSFSGKVLPPQACQSEYKLKTYKPFTLKVRAWNELSAKCWLRGRTWGFIFKLRGCGDLPGVKFTSEKNVTLPGNPLSSLAKAAVPRNLLSFPPKPSSPVIVGQSSVQTLGQVSPNYSRSEF